MQTWTVVDNFISLRVCTKHQRALFYFQTKTYLIYRRYKWEVPLTYVTDMDPKKIEPVIWMHKGSGKISH